MTQRLAPGRWYSVALSPTPQAQTSSVRAAHGVLFAQGLTVTTVHRDGDQMRFIGRFDGRVAQEALAHPDWVIAAVDPVSPPPPSILSPVLDANLDIVTAQAVQAAIATETNPKALLDFANHLLPDHPAAAALLKTHATLTLALAGGSSPHAPVATSGFGIHIDLTHFAKDVDEVASHLTKDAGKILNGKIIKTVGSIAETLSMQKGTGALFEGLVHGKNIGQIMKDVGKAYAANFKDLGPYLESAIAVFPGVGPEVASSLALGVALAEGKPMSQASIDAAAALIPGGPIVQAAFKSATTVAIGIAQHKPFSAIAISAARAALPAGPLSMAAGAAFDVGIAVTHAKTLQDAGFNAAKKLLPGGPGAQGMAFATALGESSPATVAASLEKGLKKELSAAGSDALERVHATVSKLVSDPTLAQLHSDVLAKQIGVPEAVARAGLASVSVPKNGPKGLVLVKTNRLQTLAGAPPAISTQPSVGAVKYVGTRGVTQASRDVHTLVGQESSRSLARAQDLAAATRLVLLQQTVRHYLAVPSANL